MKDFNRRFPLMEMDSSDFKNWFLDNIDVVDEDLAYLENWIQGADARIGYFRSIVQHYKRSKKNSV
jgi:hypothetical protein